MTRISRQQESPIRILVTGFQPFPKAPVNPSQLLVEELRKSHWKPAKNCRILYQVLETAYQTSEASLKRLIDQFKPDAIVQFGLHARAKGFYLESVARNRVSNQHADAHGVIPKRETIDPQGKTILRATLPLSRILNRLMSRQIPASLSMDAGDYVCNFSFYKVLDYLLKRSSHAIAGFVHVPYTKGQRRELGEKREEYGAIPKKTLIKGAQAIIRETAAFVQGKKAEEKAKRPINMRPKERRA